MSSASRGTSQQRSSGAQPPPGAKARPAEPICPYSFVPISQSLTPDLSARTRAALAASGFLASEKRFQHREKPFTGTKFDGGRAFQERRANTFHCAVRVLSPTYSGLAEISVAETEAHRVQRADQGLIVGDMAADPRFATRDMWHNGEASETDRARMFWRMAWVAQHGEDRLVGLSAITVADLRSMEELQQMWQPVDALMPVLSASKGNPVSSVAARSSHTPSANAAQRARVREQSDASEEEYQPASQPFAAGTAFVSAMFGIAVTLTFGYFAFGDKVLAPPPQPTAVDAGGSGATVADTGNSADTAENQDGAAAGIATGSGTALDEPIVLYIADQEDVTRLSEELKAPVQDQSASPGETAEQKKARKTKNADDTKAYDSAKKSIASSGFTADAMGKILFKLTTTAATIRRSRDPKAYFDPRTSRVSTGQDGTMLPIWTDNGIFVFAYAECGDIPQPASTPNQLRFAKVPDTAFCAYGPKSLLDQLKIPE